MKHSNIILRRITWYCFLLIFSSFFVSPTYANIIKIDLDGESNCNGQLDVAIYIKASNVSPDNNPIGIGSSSIFLNYNKDVVTYSSYQSAEFSASTSGQAAGANWLDQSLHSTNFHGLLNVVLQKEPGGANDYMLDKNTWLHVGTITFDWVGTEADPGIQVHDKFTMFNVPVNDGMDQRVLEDFPSVTDWDNCNSYCLTNAPIVSGITSTAASCSGGAGNDGSMVISFPDNPGRSNIEFSIDGGATFPYNSLDNAGSFTITGLYGGLYEVFSRWGDDACPIEVQDIAVGVNLAPSVTSITHENACTGTAGSITLEFPDVSTRSTISFSIDGGLTYAYNAPDNTGSFDITGLADGTYDLWTRWGAGDCPIDLQDVTISSLEMVTATAAKANSCFDDGSITMTFPNTVGRTYISFSIDGGLSYPYVTSDTVGNYVIGNLAPGSYDVWTRWGNTDCPASVSTQVVTQWELPQATSSVTGAVCSNDPNGLLMTFFFADSPQRTNIEFSLDGGVTYPYYTSDTVGSIDVTIATGTYDLWVRWGNNDCPIDMPDVTLSATEPPTVSNVSSTGACNNDGEITFSFPDHPTRTGIEFSIDGGLTFPHWSADNAGSITVGSLAPGTYDVWVRWGDSSCPVDLATATVTSGAAVSNIRVKAFLEGAFNNTTQLMSDELRVQNLIPTSEPYTALGYTHVNSTPGIQIPNPMVVLGMAGNNAIVDWVFVKVHDADNPSSVMEARPALIQRDGDLVEVDGVTHFEVNNFLSCNSSVSIYHRNHLGIQTAKGGIQFSTTNAGMTLLDLTNSATTLVGIDPVKVVGGIQTFWTADSNNDASISAGDRSATWNDRNQSGYMLTDVNLDGIVNASDRSLCWNNRNKTGIAK